MSYSNSHANRYNPSYRSSSLDSKVCFICGGVGHIASECPSSDSRSNRYGRNDKVGYRNTHMVYPNASRIHPRSMMSGSNDHSKPMCFICRKYGHIAKDCRYKNDIIDSALEPSKYYRVVLYHRNYNLNSNNCHKTGHIAKDCTEQKICRRCGEKGHIAADCSAAVRCNRCYQFGHFAKDCPNAEVCTFCHQPGHKRIDCPDKVDMCECLLKQE